mmetsp:Transcript_30602/g.49099  ORF Transcript_30602/g.49099 Transcript_30602/m.49099 type:complete len:109 (+) Transcript_30602:233-559(+)
MSWGMGRPVPMPFIARRTTVTAERPLQKRKIAMSEEKNSTFFVWRHIENLDGNSGGNMGNKTNSSGGSGGGGGVEGGGGETENWDRRKRIVSSRSISSANLDNSSIRM